MFTIYLLSGEEMRTFPSGRSALMGRKMERKKWRIHRPGVSSYGVRGIVGEGWAI